MVIAHMSRFSRALAVVVGGVVGLLGVSLAGCERGGGPGTTAAGEGQEPVACPSIMRFPEFRLELDPALTRDERLDLVVVVDGQREECALTISGVGPAREQGEAVVGPSTRTDMTCALLGVSGIRSDGSIPGFTVRGTPASVEVQMSRAGVEVAAGTYTPTYTPTEVDGPGCGTTPRASDTLRVR